MDFDYNTLSVLLPIVEDENEEYHNRCVYPMLWGFHFASEKFIQKIEKLFIKNKFYDSLKYQKLIDYEYQVMPIFRRFASYPFLLNRILDLQNSFLYDWCANIEDDGESWEGDDIDEEEEDANEEEEDADQYSGPDPDWFWLQDVLNKDKENNCEANNIDEDWDWEDYKESWQKFSDLFLGPFTAIIQERSLVPMLYLFRTYVPEDYMLLWCCWKPLNVLCKDFLKYKIDLENNSSLLPREQWVQYKYIARYLSACLNWEWDFDWTSQTSPLQITQCLHWFSWRYLRFVFGVDSLIRAHLIVVLHDTRLRVAEWQRKITKAAKEKQLIEESKIAFERIKYRRYDSRNPFEKMEQDHNLDNDANTQKNSDVLITEENVATVLSNWTGVPVNKISEPDLKRLSGMEDELKNKIIGQNVAISTVCNAIQGARSGLRNPNRPIASFLFAGPTGVGKTQLAKELAQYFFDDDDSVIRLDMSEFMEKQTFAKMVGAPPGYLGYEEGGQLTEAVRKKPYSMVLFDEIEKAHPDVFNLLLQILEDGRLTDSQGRTVDFKNTIIVLTSNVGTKKEGFWFLDYSEDDLGFFGEDMVDEEYLALIQDVTTELRQHFRPEFLNRLDEIIVFRRLSMSNLDDIADLMLDELCNRAREKSIELEITKKARHLLVNEAYHDMDYGARPLRRIIAKRIEDPLAIEYLKFRSKFGTNTEIRIIVDKGRNGKIEVRPY